MEDVLRRLGSLEADVTTIKTEVGAMVVQLPHLATKADVSAIKAEVGAIAVQLPHLATKAEVAQLAAQLPHMATKADVSDAKTSIIQWMVGTMITVAALAFTIAKFVH